MAAVVGFFVMLLVGVSVAMTGLWLIHPGLAIAAAGASIAGAAPVLAEWLDH